MNSTSSKLHFSLPPITEAIIAFQFAEPVADRWIQKLPLKLKKEYATKVTLKNYSVSIDAAPSGEDASSIKVEDLGLRLASNDQTNLLQVAPTFISFHRRAPYIDWEDILASAQNGLSMLDQIAGSVPLKSIATRYLNRIDIPFENAEKKSIEFENYFSLYSITPSSFEPMTMSHTAWSRTFEDLTNGYRYTINFSSTPPVILDHHSFILDIEVSSTGLISAKRGDLWPMLENFRREKNRAFLACLTPATIGLFK